MTNAWWKSLLPVTAVLLVIAALVARGARLGCHEGAATPLLTLMPTYAQTHPNAIGVQLCIRGGECATAPLETDAAGTERATYPASQQTPTRSVSAMQFGRLIPARIASQGPDGGLIQLTVTVYGRSGPILSASATFSPLRSAPTHQCEVRAYAILVQLTPDGALRYYPIA